MKLLCSLILGILPLATLAAPPDEPQQVRARVAGAHLNALGISSYRLVRSAESDEVAVELHDYNSSKVATISYRFPAASAILVHYQTDYGTDLVLHWTPSDGEVVLTDNGIDHKITFDAEKRTKSVSAEADLAFRSRITEIKEIAVTLEDLQARGVVGRSASGTRKLRPQSADDGDPFDNYGGGGCDTGGGPPCTGPNVRGTGIGEMTRSAICQLATDDANGQCWNNQCIGCCRLYPCDAYCILDDYLCVVAGVTGTSCG